MYDNVPGAELVGPPPHEIESTIYFCRESQYDGEASGSGDAIDPILEEPGCCRGIKAKGMTPE